MTATALIAEATRQGVRLWVEGGQVRVRAPSTPPADLLARLRANRDDLKRLLTDAAPPQPVASSRPSVDAWGLSDADRTEAVARLSAAPAPAQAEAAVDPEPMDHDAAERAAMTAHYAASAADGYRPEAPDELRDGLLHGFHSHRAAWEALPCVPERGRAFAEVRREPGACPNCASRRWWCVVGEPATDLRCTTCHPPDHLRPEAIHEVNT